MTASLVLGLAGAMVSLLGAAILITNSIAHVRHHKDRIRRHWTPIGSFPTLSFGTKQRQSLASRWQIPPSIAKGIWNRTAVAMVLQIVLIAVATRSHTARFIWLGGTLILGIWILRPAVESWLGRKRNLAAIEMSLASEIEKMAIYLAAGHSVNSALEMLSLSHDSPSSKVFELISRGTKSGVDATDAIAEAMLTYPCATLSRLANLLEGANFGADLVRGARIEASDLRNEGHRKVLAEMEKNSQKIWIPITIAALIPGIVLIFVPFIAVMNAVAGH